MLCQRMIHHIVPCINQVKMEQLKVSHLIYAKCAGSFFAVLTNNRIVFICINKRYSVSKVHIVFIFLNKTVIFFSNLFSRFHGRSNGSMLVS